MYIDFSIPEIEEIISEAFDEAADKLRNNHPWNNDTGELRDSIVVEDNQLRIEADYASIVDERTPYVDELVNELEASITYEIEMYIEGI